MKRRTATRVALLILAWAVLSCVATVPTPAPGGIQNGESGQWVSVVTVVDGDTIRVAIGDEVVAVRYIGIDAPESAHSGASPEWFAAEATEANRGLVEGRDVYLEKDISNTDRYGRLLRYVFLDDGTFVNAELVRLGHAMAKAYRPDVSRQETLAEMQRQAQEAGLGLWAGMPTAVEGGG